MHRKDAKGIISCQGNTEAIEGDHARIEYEAVIQYKKPPKGNS
jgi:hypothetical protein